MKKEQMDRLVNDLIVMEKNPNCHGFTKTGETNWDDRVRGNSYNYGKYVNDYCKSRGLAITITKEEMGEIFDKVYFATI